MAHLKNTNTPASAPGFTWETPEDVIEITDPDLARDLVRLAHGGFVEVLPGDPDFPEPTEPRMRKTPITEPAPKHEPTEPPPRPGARPGPKTPIAE